MIRLERFRAIRPHQGLMSNGRAKRKTLGISWSNHAESATSASLIDYSPGASGTVVIRFGQKEAGLVPFWMAYSCIVLVVELRVLHSGGIY